MRTEQEVKELLTEMEKERDNIEKDEEFFLRDVTLPAANAAIEIVKWILEMQSDFTPPVNAANGDTESTNQG